MVNPSSLAFGDRGCTSRQTERPSTDFTTGRCMATVHETADPTPFTDGAPGTFMGPTLWSADRDIFDGGHGGHYDMLHNSPNGMGVAWAGEGTAFWVFDGYHSSITLYEFHGDHGPGGTRHEDGVVTRFAEGEVSRVPGVPSHMAFDTQTRILYIADTGNQRVAVLHADSGDRGQNYGPNYDFSRQTRRDNASIETLIDGSEFDMAAPSGLALRDGVLYVGDNSSGRISAFTVEGELIDYLDTKLPPSALKGIAFHESGDLFVVDAQGHRVMRVAPLEANP